MMIHLGNEPMIDFEPLKPPLPALPSLPQKSNFLVLVQFLRLDNFYMLWDIGWKFWKVVCTDNPLKKWTDG